MLRTRVIPTLLLRGTGLVKTVRFRDARYLGDPRNAVRIFSEKEVDELVLLDIEATPRGREPQYDLIHEIVSEAFMPIAYGGGLRSVEQCRRVLELGVEKVVLNTSAHDRPALVSEAAGEFGSQSVVVAIDAKRKLLGGWQVVVAGGTRGVGRSPAAVATQMADAGAGELFLTSIDREGTFSGYDLDLVRQVSDAVSVPVIACGGAGTLQHLADAVRSGGASAAAAGSMFVYHGRHRAVLINFPTPQELGAVFARAAAGESSQITGIA